MMYKYSTEKHVALQWNPLISLDYKFAFSKAAVLEADNSVQTGRWPSFGMPSVIGTPRNQ